MENNGPKPLSINRRWAEREGIGKEEGYATGIRKIGDVLKWCKEFDVTMLTMWGFSMDNFKRDQYEVQTLFGLFKENLKKAIDSDDRNKTEMRVRFYGRIHLFPPEIQKMIKMAEQNAGGPDAKYQLNLLLSYGGRRPRIKFWALFCGSDRGFVGGGICYLPSTR